MTKSFEEEFPSLKIKINKDNNEPYYSMWTMERLLEDIQKHCVDKQRASEVIIKLSEGKFNDQDNCGYTWNIGDVIDFLNKELGLEE